MIQRRALFAVGVVLVASIIGFVGTMSSDSSILRWIPLTLIAAFLLVFSWSEKSKDFLLPSQIFVWFYVLFFVVASIQWLPDPHILWAFWLENVTYEAIFISAIGLAAFMLGWKVTRVKMAEVQSLFSMSPHTSRNLFRAVTVFDLFGVVLTLLMFHKSGIPVLHKNDQVLRLDFAQSNQILLTAVSFSWHFSIFTSLALIKSTRGKSKRLLLILSILVGFLAFFTFGSRYYLIDPGIASIFIIHYYIRKIKPRELLLLALIGISSLSIYGVIRESSYFGHSQASIYVDQLGFPNRFWAMFAPALEYIREPVVVLGHEISTIPRHIPFQLGGLLINPLLEILPGHHATEDVWLKDRIMEISFNIGAGTPGTMLSTFYGDFGTVGVVLAMLLLGSLLKYTYSQLSVRQSFAYTVISVILTKDALMGVFLNVFPFILNVVEPILFFWLIQTITNENTVVKSKMLKPLVTIFMLIVGVVLIWIKTGALQ